MLRDFIKEITLIFPVIFSESEHETRNRGTLTHTHTLAKLLGESMHNEDHINYFDGRSASSLVRIEVLSSHINTLSIIDGC